MNHSDDIPELKPLAAVILTPYVEESVLLPEDINTEALVAQAIAALKTTAAQPPQGVSTACSFSLVVADDAEIQNLNRDYRGKDKPTNVLSFPDHELDEDGVFYLGDIMISLETTAAEAAAQQKPLAEHLVHLMIHGLLHLLGYDHIDDAEAEEMEALEIAALSYLKIQNPYLIEEDE